MDKDQRVAYLQELKQIAIDGFERYRAGFERLNSAYLLCFEENQIQSLKKRNKSRNFIPKLNSKAKRIYDGLSETYFNNDKFAKLEPYINSTNDVIDKWQEAIDHYTEQINLYKVFSPIFLKAPFSATCVVKVYWSDERVKIEEVNIDEIFFDPNARSVDDISFIVHKIYLSKESILNYVKSKIFKADMALFDEKKDYERFTLYEIYEKKGGVWFVSTIYENELLRDEIRLNDGQPFVFGYMLPQIKKIDDEDFICAYGEPALSAMLPLQDELNINRNSVCDVVRNQVSPKLILPKMAMVEASELERVGTPIYVDSPQGVQILPSGDIGGAMAIAQVIENELSEVSGVSPQQNGVSTTRKETATMASIMANEGSVRLQGYIRTFNETFFEPIFQRLALLVWKYGDAMFFAGFNRGEAPSFKVNLNTGIGALNKEVQKKSLMDVSGLINAQFGMCLQIGDNEGALVMKEASKKVLLELLPLFGIKDADKFIGEDKKDALKAQVFPEQQNQNLNQFNQGVM